MSSLLNPVIWLPLSIVGSAVVVLLSAKGYNMYHDMNETSEDNLIRLQAQNAGSKKYKKKYLNRTKRFR